MAIKKIFVVGAGTMGKGIAQAAATSGFEVTCMDVVPAALEKARAVIDKSTARLVEKGSLTVEQKRRADAIAFVTDNKLMLNLRSLADCSKFKNGLGNNQPGMRMRIFR